MLRVIVRDDVKMKKRRTTPISQVRLMVCLHCISMLSKHVIDAIVYLASADDPNIISPGDQMDNYTALDSDGDNEDDSVYDDDNDDLGPEEPDPVDEDDLYSPELHFQPSLLERVGGVAAISRGSVDAHVLTDIKFNGWIGPETETPLPYMDEPYEERPANGLRVDYPDIFTWSTGRSAHARSSATRLYPISTGGSASATCA
jgi:hypothetical protein